MEAAALRPDVVARCRSGEGGAWRDLYDEQVERVWRFLARMGVPAADVEDVTQEVFVVVHRRLHEFDGRVALSTWVLGIALRLARNYRRQKWRQRVSRLVGWTPTASEGADPERRLAVKEAACEADAILARMSERKRAVFVLYEVEGLDGPAIAALLRCPEHTVWSRLRHARVEFSRLLRQRRFTSGEETP